MRSIIGTIVYSWVGEHVWVTQRMRENVIHPCLGLVAFCEVGRGQGRSLHLCCWSLEGFLDGALSSPGLIWSSCLQTVQSPTWTLMVIGTSSFASDFPLVEPLEGDFQMQSITYGQSTPIPIKPHRNLYVLHFKHREIDTLAALWEALKLWSIYAHLINCKLLPWHPGMNTDKGIKRWTDLMHGRDTAVPGNLSRLKSTQIRHYCLTRNYRLHCRSKEKRDKSRQNT